MTKTFKNTVFACYRGYITQATVNNLAPLLFIIFQTRFGLSFEEVGRLILLNFFIQILMDLLSVKFLDRIGYRAGALLAHAFCCLGLILLGVLPQLLASPYLGLIIAVIFYACGGGILEVLVSPIVDNIPSSHKASAMSLLHSFYCWGQVAVVFLSSLALWLFGQDFWPWLPILWAILPLYNLITFLQVPLPKALSLEELIPVKKLLTSKIFVLFLLLMLCAGASELVMSQWASLFAEEALGLPKFLGDILGPGLFAIFMGLGRMLYGLYGAKIHLKGALFLSSITCTICYALTIFSQNPYLALAGCAFCGFTVSLMWPGTFSMSSAGFPLGGTAMFALLAMFGDLGGALGPWLTGFVSDLAENGKLGSLSNIVLREGMEASQLGLKTGLLIALIFPLLMALVLVALPNHKEPPISDLSEDVE